MSISNSMSDAAVFDATSRHDRNNKNGTQGKDTEHKPPDQQQRPPFSLNDNKNIKSKTNQTSSASSASWSSLLLPPSAQRPASTRRSDVSRHPTFANTTTTRYCPKDGLVRPSRENDPRPTGLRLMFIGDSLTRYHYIAFTYFLAHGQWIPPERKGPNPCRERSYKKGWAEFMAKTTLPGGLEFCDCCRPPPNRLDLCSENRYYYDSCLDNMVVYIQIFERPQGRIDPVQAFEHVWKKQASWQKQQGVTLDIPPCGHDVPLTWTLRRYDGFADVIRYIARNLPLYPTHAVMNRGIWPGRWFDNATRIHDLYQALQGDSNDNNGGNSRHPKYKPIIGIWRTTTAPQNRTYLGKEDDQVMVQFWRAHNLPIQDASFTFRMRPGYFWDKLHMWEAPNRVLSEDLLLLLGHTFPPGYQRYDVNVMLEKQS